MNYLHFFSSKFHSFFLFVFVSLTSSPLTFLFAALTKSLLLSSPSFRFLSFYLQLPPLSLFPSSPLSFLFCPSPFVLFMNLSLCTSFHLSAFLTLFFFLCTVHYFFFPPFFNLIFSRLSFILLIPFSSFFFSIFFLHSFPNSFPPCMPL